MPPMSDTPTGKSPAPPEPPAAASGSQSASSATTEATPATESPTPSARPSLFGGQRPATLWGKPGAASPTPLSGRLSGALSGSRSATGDVGDEMPFKPRLPGSSPLRLSHEATGADTEPAGGKPPPAPAQAEPPSQSGGLLGRLSTRTPLPTRPSPGLGLGGGAPLGSLSKLASRSESVHRSHRDTPAGLGLFGARPLPAPTPASAPVKPASEAPASPIEARSEPSEPEAGLVSAPEPAVATPSIESSVAEPRETEPVATSAAREPSAPHPAAPPAEAAAPAPASEAASATLVTTSSVRMAEVAPAPRAAAVDRRFDAFDEPDAGAVDRTDAAAHDGADATTLDDLDEDGLSEDSLDAGVALDDDLDDELEEDDPLAGPLAAAASGPVMLAAGAPAPQPTLSAYFGDALVERPSTGLVVMVSLSALVLAAVVGLALGWFF